jgi:hypothetical protein
MQLDRAHGFAKVGDCAAWRTTLTTPALQQTRHRQQQEVTTAEGRLQQAQAMQGAVGGVATEIEDGRRDLGPGEHRPALDLAVSGERFQRGGHVRGAEGGA